MDNINGVFIHWPEQCNYCLRALNTTYCGKNQAFMKKLDSMNHEYVGTVDFVCDYFTLDKEKIKDKQNEENDM